MYLEFLDKEKKATTKNTQIKTSKDMKSNPLNDKTKN
jgi:hypothetical protein